MGKKSDKKQLFFRKLIIFQQREEAGIEVLKQPLIMSIKKTGIALWRGSDFLLRTLKKKNTVFCPSIFLFVILQKEIEAFEYLNLFFIYGQYVQVLFLYELTLL